MEKLGTYYKILDLTDENWDMLKDMIYKKSNIKIDMCEINYEILLKYHHGVMRRRCDAFYFIRQYINSILKDIGLNIRVR